VLATGYTALEAYLNGIVPPGYGVSVGGHLTTVNGHGLPRVSLSLYNPLTGASQSAVTDRNGNYVFADVPAGETFIVAVQSRRYPFRRTAHIVSAAENVTGLDFMANTEN
jgi:hypothetical protein